MHSFTLTVIFWARDDVQGQKILKKQPIPVPACHKATTVAELKAHVASVTNITVNLILQQRTPEGKARGKVLDDDSRTLSELGMDDGQSLICVYAVAKPVASSASWTNAVGELERQGLHHHHSGGDGNCLFRSVSRVVYGTEDHHNIVRQRCMDYMVVQVHAFEQMTASELHQGGFQDYIAAKRMTDGSGRSWGDSPELLAMSELYRRPVQVWTPDDSEVKWRIIATYSESLQSPPIRVCFLGQGHYDAIVPSGAAAEDAGCLQHPGEQEDKLIKQVNSRTAEEVVAIESERTAYRQLLNGGNLDQRITEQVRLESLSQLRLESAQAIDQATNESMRIEFQKETEAAVEASQRDAEEMLQDAVQQSIQDEDQRILDATANASAAEQQRRMEDALKKATADSIKEKLVADLVAMGVDRYKAEYAAENKSDVESAFAFLEHQSEGNVGNLTPTSGQQQQQASSQVMDQAIRESIETQIIASMVQCGYPEWQAQYAAKNASDLESAIAFIQDQM